MLDDKGDINEYSLFNRKAMIEEIKTQNFTRADYQHENFVPSKCVYNERDTHLLAKMATSEAGWDKEKGRGNSAFFQFSMNSISLVN